MWSQGYMCALIFISLKELPNEKKKDFSNSSTCYNCRNTPQRQFGRKNWQKMKIPNSGLSVFTSGSTGRVYQLQDRSSCRMRYLHYPTLETTRSFIKIIAKRKKRISLIPPPVTTAEIRPSRNLAEKNWQKIKFPNSGLNVHRQGLPTARS